MTTLRKTLVLTALAWSLAGCGEDSATFTIAGRVVNQSGLLVPAASVSAITWAVWNHETTQPGQVFAVKSDAQGAFELRVRGGDWAVVAAYETCSSPVFKATGKTGQAVDVTLVISCAP